MPKSLQDLNLNPDVVVGGVDDISDLPEYGGYTPPPPPGTYGFKAPLFRLTDPVWETFDASSEGQPNKGERVSITFDSAHPLLIVMTPPSPLSAKYLNEPFETRINNSERKRDKAGEIVASDADYLLRACGMTKRPSPATNINYCKALSASIPGKTFSADVEYSYACNPKREAQVPDGAGGYTSMGKNGCNERYYQSQVTKNPDGTMPDRVVCTCGAHVRGFANLTNIKPWSPAA